MHLVLNVLLVILVIAVIALAVLYFLGRKLEKRWKKGAEKAGRAATADQRHETDCLHADH